MNVQATVRIATRASQLALWQANHIADSIRQQSPATVVELVEISTTGDRDQTGALRNFGGQGVFTSEVQNALLEGRADVAVHSLKDLPTEPVDGLLLAAVPERAPRYDVLVLPEPLSETEPVVISAATTLANLLPPDARIGTSSPRRLAQLLHAHAGYQMLEIRGNVDTRLRKLNAGDYDAIILAEAGLRRLQLEQHITAILIPELMYPAIGQGALGLECRADNADVAQLLAGLNHPATFSAVLAERSLLRELRAGCHAPLGVQTHLQGQSLTLEAVVLSLDGVERIASRATGSCSQPEEIGMQLADLLRSLGASQLL